MIDWNEPALKIYPLNCEQPLMIKEGSHGPNTRLTIDQLRDAWSRMRSNAVIDRTCFVSTWKPSKEGGYVQVSINNKKYCIHHVSHMLFKRQYRSDQPVSHRCANTKCFNPEHLVQESQGSNELRKNCNLNASYSSCPHSPPCIYHPII